jgi:hypothetical protein
MYARDSMPVFRHRHLVAGGRFLRKYHVPIRPSLLVMGIGVKHMTNAIDLGKRLPGLTVVSKLFGTPENAVLWSRRIPWSENADSGGITEDCAGVVVKVPASERDMDARAQFCRRTLSWRLPQANGDG